MKFGKFSRILRFYKKSVGILSSFEYNYDYFVMPDSINHKYDEWLKKEADSLKHLLNASVRIDKVADRESVFDYINNVKCLLAKSGDCANRKKERRKYFRSRCGIFSDLDSIKIPETAGMSKLQA